MPRKTEWKKPWCLWHLLRIGIDEIVTLSSQPRSYIKFEVPFATSRGSIFFGSKYTLKPRSSGFARTGTSLDIPNSSGFLGNLWEKRLKHQYTTPALFYCCFIALPCWRRFKIITVQIITVPSQLLYTWQFLC